MIQNAVTTMITLDKQSKQTCKFIITTTGEISLINFDMISKEDWLKQCTKIYNVLKDKKEFLQSKSTYTEFFID